MHDTPRKLQRHLLRRRLAVAPAVLLSLALLVPEPVGVVADTPHSGFQTPMRHIFRVLTVDNDFMRAFLTLETFRQRPDLPSDLTEYTVSWVEALKELQAVEAPDEVLPYARTLIGAGQGRNRFPSDRLGLVHFKVGEWMLLCTS